MAILATVRYRVQPGRRAEFWNAILQAGIPEKSRAEAGNRDYRFFFPAEGEEDLCILEIWTSRAAQSAHAETPHYQALSRLKAEYVTEVSVTAYEIPD